MPVNDVTGWFAKQYFLGAAGIASEEALGLGTIAIGAVDILGVGIASAEALGLGNFIFDQDIFGTGIASAEALGLGTVVPGPVDISGTAIPSDEALGLGLITPGAVNISGTGIASAEALGLGNFVFDQNISGTGIVSAEALGLGGVALDHNPPLNDSFDRANAANLNGVTNDWTDRTTAKLKILSNAAVADTTASWICESYNYSVLTNDGRVTVRIAGTPANGEFYLIGLFCSNSKQMWAVIAPSSSTTGSWSIQSNATSYATPIGALTNRSPTPGSGGLVADDVIDFEKVGQAWVLKRNGITMTTFFDSANAYTVDQNNRQGALGGYLIAGNGYKDWSMDDVA